MIIIVTKDTTECTKLYYIEKILQEACSQNPLATSRSGMYFNTSYSLKLYHPWTMFEANVDLGL